MEVLYLSSDSVLGKNGTDGTNATNGTNVTNGTNGTNGVGISSVSIDSSGSSGFLHVNLSKNTTYQSPTTLFGSAGSNGSFGVGVSNVSMDSSGYPSLTLSNNSVYKSPISLIGPAGIAGSSSNSSSSFLSSELYKGNSANTVQTTDSGGLPFAMFGDGTNFNWWLYNGNFTNVAVNYTRSFSGVSVNMMSKVRWVSGSEQLFALYLFNLASGRIWHDALNSIDFRPTGFTVTTGTTNASGMVSSIDYYITIDHQVPTVSAPALGSFPRAIPTDFWTKISEVFYIYFQSKVVNGQNKLSCTFFDIDGVMFFQVSMKVVYPTTHTTTIRPPKRV